MYLIYSKPNCTFCEKAKNLLKQKDIPYKALNLDQDFTKEELIDHFQQTHGIIPRTMPQIVFKDDTKETYIGGFAELEMRV